MLTGQRRGGADSGQTDCVQFLRHAGTANDATAAGRTRGNRGERFSPCPAGLKPHPGTRVSACRLCGNPPMEFRQNRCAVRCVVSASRPRGIPPHAPLPADGSFRGIVAPMRCGHREKSAHTQCVRSGRPCSVRQRHRIGIPGIVPKATMQTSPAAPTTRFSAANPRDRGGIGGQRAMSRRNAGGVVGPAHMPIVPANCCPAGPGPCAICVARLCAPARVLLAAIAAGPCAARYLSFPARGFSPENSQGRLTHPARSEGYR